MMVRAQGILDHSRLGLVKSAWCTCGKLAVARAGVEWDGCNLAMGRAVEQQLGGNKKDLNIQ